MNDYSGYEIFKNLTHLQGPSMETFQITPILIESDLGGIFPDKKGQINYGISMWICITKTHKNYRSIFHNGSKKGLPSPAIGIHPNQTTIHFRHDSEGLQNKEVSLADFPLDLKTWYQLAISVCGCKVTLYLNGEPVQIVYLQGEPSMPSNFCYLVDPWHDSAEGISVSNFHWFPFGISNEFVKSVSQIPRSTERKEKQTQNTEKEIEREKFLLEIDTQKITWSDYEVVKDITELTNSLPKKHHISPVQVESDLGGIKPKNGQVQYGISMRIKITKNRDCWRSIFHNGLRVNHCTPAVWIHPNEARISFLHDSTLKRLDGLDLNDFTFELQTWYHWAVSVCGTQVVHYINGEAVQKGELEGEALMPINDCWLVAPWLNQSEGIIISDFYWFPFGISDEFVRLVDQIPRSQEKGEEEKQQKEEEMKTKFLEKKKKDMIIQRFDQKINNLTLYEIVKDETELKGPSMKQFQISPIQIESDLGGIKPKNGQAHYGISMWIRITKKHDKWRSIFHNGLRNDHRTPGIWVPPNETTISFSHDSTVEDNDTVNMTHYPLKLYTWHHWTVSVCGHKVVHYLDGEVAQRGYLKGEALMPIKDCWLVDPWQGCAEGIHISGFHWFPFGISAEFVKYVRYMSPDPMLKKKQEKKQKEEEDLKKQEFQEYKQREKEEAKIFRKLLFKVFDENLKLSDYQIIKDITKLKGPSMKNTYISPIMIDEGLGGIDPTEGQVHYGISMWIRITKRHKKLRSIFHNGSTNERRTPAVWIHPDQTTIHFRHDSATQKNDGLDLTDFTLDLNVWYHWAVSVCGTEIVHYINGDIAQKGNLKGQALEPGSSCWIVDPWHGSADGIIIRNFHWLPFGLSDEFAVFAYHNPISQEVQEKEKEREKFFFQNFSQGIDLSRYEIVKKKTQLKGPSMKKILLDRVSVQSSYLGGIKPQNGEVNYAISMWIRINKTHDKWRSVFHNGLTDDHRTPAIWIRPNTTQIHFRHDSNIKKNDGLDLTKSDLNLKTWYHWGVSVSGCQVVHYINGEIVEDGYLEGDPLKPIETCWLVDPWYNSSKGITVRNLHWFPFAISDMFAKFVYQKHM
ncbi:hypothetical protein M0813_02675 [Anaeramoeba flamelloides]|uniref:Uncharacterized protein n=1 Tax=Anaeramoeba flamelloides TaxID=1746091 RepID=A0ABQ8YE07_9EUKA|nr:hypothetical protein M0813_02675 [Anaeramoeba flamelloides]